jgi:hypothetical protein
MIKTLNKMIENNQDVKDWNYSIAFCDSILDMWKELDNNIFLSGLYELLAEKPDPSKLNEVIQEKTYLKSQHFW